MEALIWKKIQKNKLKSKIHIKSKKKTKKCIMSCFIVQISKYVPPLFPPPHVLSKHQRKYGQNRFSMS